jgi:uncharacterized protein (DUF305 family)
MGKNKKQTNKKPHTNKQTNKKTPKLTNKKPQNKTERKTTTKSDLMFVFEIIDHHLEFTKKQTYRISYFLSFD